MLELELVLMLDLMLDPVLELELVRLVLVLE